MPNISEPCFVCLTIVCEFTNMFVNDLSFPEFILVNFIQFFECIHGLCLFWIGFLFFRCDRFVKMLNDDLGKYIKYQLFHSDIQEIKFVLSISQNYQWANHLDQINVFEQNVQKVSYLQDAILSCGANETICPKPDLIQNHVVDL